jgi:hypothetical protein
VEEVYEEVSSQYFNSEKKGTVYEEGDTFDRKASTAKREDSGRIKYNQYGDLEIPEAFTSEENKSQTINTHSQPAEGDVFGPDYNNDMQLISNEIEYAYVEESIKQKKWINRSVMEKRDKSRVEDSRRKEANHSIQREFQDQELQRRQNRVHIGKKSRKLAQVALKKNIRSVVNTYSQNGYLAFENYLHVLFMLQITQNIGRVDDNFHYSERIKRAKQERDSNELEFALQMWNKIN